MNRLWLNIVVLWLLGVLAAAQFAKMSIIAPLLQAAFGLSLLQLGWLISLLEVGGGLFGFVAGLMVAATGVRRFLLLGLVTLSAASLVEAIAPTPHILFAARAIEGIGYVLAIIAAPTAIAAMTDGKSRPRALALWSTFVPVGIAAGGAISGLTAGMFGVRGVLLLWSILVALCIPVAMRLPIPETPRQRTHFPVAAAWITTFGFGLYTVFISILTMLLPSFLIEQSRATLAEAATIAALASLAVLPGTVLAMAVMRGGEVGARLTMLLSTLGLAATVPLVVMLYGTAGSDLLTRGGLAILAVAVSGVVPPLVFARLPLLAAAATPDDPRIATANGLITQFGAGGALIGPPLGAAIVGQWGWAGLGIAVSVLVVAMLVTFVAAECVHLRREAIPAVS